MFPPNKLQNGGGGGGGGGRPSKDEKTLYPMSPSVYTY